MKILITAGPTHEPIDPVRFISNHSTGKMGVAIASKLMEEGAEVHLVCGPLQVQIPAGIYAYKVDSAAQMLDHCLRLFPLMDAAILSAAVADYTPTTVATEKVKKKSNDWNLELTKTIDIASELGKLKTNKQFLVGFALETNNEIENALDKLKKKNLDFIVLNSLRDEGAGFGSDTNKITILDTNNNQTDFPLKLKSEVATDIVAKLIELLHA
jgi:phosphopantothenoylcysteine decarboxylase/phosphopantothenate--cysteine ligase